MSNSKELVESKISDSSDPWFSDKKMLCLECGKRFSMYHKKQKFCKAVCRVRYSRRKGKMKQIENKKDDYNV
jgi:hypothetical protein